MKHHQGVTLLELLGIIVVLSILALIFVPIMTSLSRRTQYRAFESTLMNVEQATRLRRYEFPENPPNFETVLLEDGITNPSSTNNQHWKRYGELLLGPYIQGAMPEPPYGGIFSYRFYTESEGFNTGSWNHSRRLRAPIISSQGELKIGRQLRETYFLPTEAVTGEFIQIRFGENNNQLNGQFDLINNKENTEAFIRTIEFLLKTSFADRVFVYDRRTQNQ